MLGELKTKKNVVNKNVIKEFETLSRHGVKTKVRIMEIQCSANAHNKLEQSVLEVQKRFKREIQNSKLEVEERKEGPPEILKSLADDYFRVGRLTEADLIYKEVLQMSDVAPSIIKNVYYSLARVNNLLKKSDEIMWLKKAVESEYLGGN